MNNEEKTKLEECLNQLLIEFKKYNPSMSLGAWADKYKKIEFIYV